MKRLTLLFVIVLLCGCSPQKRLTRLLDRYPLPTDTVIQYRDTTIWRDTTITVILKGDTVRNSIFVYLEADMADTSLKTRSNLAEASAGIHDNQLWLELIQYDSVVAILIQNAIRENTDSIFIEIVREVPKIIPPKPFYKNGFFILAGLILVSMILLFVFLFLKK